MKKLLFTCLLSAFTALSFSQTTITSKCTTDFSCSQKYGITTTEREYTLTVVYDKDSLKFTTGNGTIFSPLNTFSITKKTDKYIVGTNSDGNYGFFDIGRKQFYNIDYYMSRYLTMGYGSKTTEVKETVLKMMEILKKVGSQRDVVQELIKQAEYDF
ncbi:hypothetical protein SY27_07740 [Flavobacterium sp. 316]|uniref:hypothetical protein n=1 Tax=Flavobacterium sp. 316 TaxID=1603293 RepID=UPI0005E82461|nr:hypothetical protein [Flavobacterium sp. 316]KIX21581.1 hypothetical protein SY27_07740 [Flavobacterium sp. 316]